MMHEGRLKDAQRSEIAGDLHVEFWCHIVAVGKTLI